MTNAPPTRKTHVIRIFGTNKAGDVLSNIWADVERIDVMKNVTQTTDSPNYQGYQRKFKWMDNPDDDSYDPDGNPARKTVIVKVCSPDEDVNDPEEWIPIQVIKSLHARESDTGLVDRFHTGVDGDPVETARVIEVRKISHYDTNIDDAAQAALDGDPSRKAFVVQGVDYQRDNSTKDDSQFVDHEIITYLKHRTNETSKNSSIVGGVNRGRQTKLLNQYMIDESDEPDGSVTGVDGINPPYRLDPYQNIINVRFRTLYLVVSVGGGNNSFSFGPYGASPGVGAPSLGSKDNNAGVKLLDTFDIPSGNTSAGGFIGCFVYPTGLSAEESWVLFQTTGLAAGTFAAVNNACPWPGPSPQPENSSIAPINFQAFATSARDYLYSIPAGEGIVSVSIGGIVATSSTGDGISTEVNMSGGGTISVAVYSTVRGRVTKLSQLADYSGDGKPRPTEDDNCSLGITHDTQGGFLVNVKLDTNKDHVQTDNYGRKFQPFKVTLDHGGAIDGIPSQPPVRLTP